MQITLIYQAHLIYLLNQRSLLHIAYSPTLMKTDDIFRLEIRIINFDILS